LQSLTENDHLLIEVTVVDKLYRDVNITAWKGLVWTNMAQDRDKLEADVSTAMNFHSSSNVQNFTA
jgi:hypothetical protein